MTTMMSRRRASNVFSLFLQLLFSRHQKLASKNALDKRLSNVTLWIVKCTSFSRKDLRVSDLLYSNFSYDFVRFLMRALLVILFARNEGILHHIQKRFRHFSPQESGTHATETPRAMTTTTANESAVVIKTLAPNHFCLDQNLNPSVVQTIAKSLPWYGPKFSPHAVPNFYDVSGITENPEAFKLVIDTFAERYESMKEKPTKIAGFDARGFLFGPTIAMRLGIPFVMIRKAGKLPGVLVSSGEYVTEYSTDETVMRFGAIDASDRVVLIDDLIATGGTALAGFELCHQLGATVHEFAAMIELPFLDGVKKIHEYKDGLFKDVPCFTVVDCLTIGEDMGRDPIGEDVPRVVKAEEVGMYEVDEETGKVKRKL